MADARRRARSAPASNGGSSSVGDFGSIGGDGGFDFGGDSGSCGDCGGGDCS
ncbi:MAG: hypothetical protein KIT80_24015 [Chitinophagaceae bacterium]|nr:hypothetical protein [Chitinophagaceae bacterium]